MVQEQVRGRLDELSNRRAFDALRVDGGVREAPDARCVLRQLDSYPR